MPFQRATRQQARLRMAIIGPAGCGKTMTALKLATALGGRMAVIDTEHGSASHYADQFEFDSLEMTNFDPRNYVKAIGEAETAGYDVLIIDSLSHAWMGHGGALEMVDQAAKRSQSGNSFAAWRDVTPLHNQLVEAMLASKLHLIVTLRAKTEYAMEQDDKTKRMTVRKLGLAPVQRDGLEYEFDVTADMTLDNVLIVSKTRCAALTGKMFEKPGDDLAQIIRTWLSGGAPAAPSPAPKPQPQQQRPPTQQQTAQQPPPKPSPQPQPTNGQSKLDPLITLKIADKDYRVPRQFESLDQPALDQFATDATMLYTAAAEDMDALKAAWTIISSNRANMPESVFTWLGKIKDINKKKLEGVTNGR